MVISTMAVEILMSATVNRVRRRGQTNSDHAPIKQIHSFAVYHPAVPDTSSHPVLNQHADRAALPPGTVSDRSSVGRRPP